MRFAVLTSGGDAPGMNAAIRSAVKASMARGHEVLGIERGYAGLLAGDVRPLTIDDVDGISRFGGTILGTARSQVFPTEAGQREAAQIIEREGIDGLLVIGGNGSLTGAHALAQHAPCKVVGLAASIDNDVGHCHLSIGVDTAVNTIVEACDRISDTARAHRRAFVVEVMGRMCGYLAMRAGIAADADAILYRERDMAEDDMIRRLKELMIKSFSARRSKRRVLIIKSEGVAVPTHALVDRLGEAIATDLPDVAVRSTILGHVVRGGSPSATDRVMGQRLALAATWALERGAHDVMLAWEAPRGIGEATDDPAVRSVPLADVLAETKNLLDGTSAVTKRRVGLLSKVEGILAL